MVALPFALPPRFGPRTKGQDSMAWFASDSDRTLRHASARWDQTAFYEVEDIGCWRLATDIRIDPGPDAHYSRIVSGIGWDMPTGFGPDTAFILGQANRYPNLDFSPLQDIHAAVVSWHASRNARRIAPQAVLEATLERARVVVHAILVLQR